MIQNVERYALFKGPGKSLGRQKCGSHSLCSVLGGMEPGSFQTCIQYNVFDQFKGTQERKMEREMAARTVVEAKWGSQPKFAKSVILFAKWEWAKN